MIRYKYAISYLLFSFATIIIFSSYHGGAANGGLGNMTGSPGAGNCGNCHNGGQDTTYSTITIKKKGDTASNTIKYYTANSLYTITVRGKHSQYDMFGFQAVVLDTNKNPVGNFINFDNYSQGYPAIKSLYAENNTRIPKDTNDWFEVNFDWRAPAISSGELTLYGIVNAVNNNGQPSFDKTGKTMAINFVDSTPLNYMRLNYDTAVKLFPNPADKTLFINVAMNISPEIIQLQTLQGITIANITIDKRIANNEYHINTTDIPNGHYILILAANNTSNINRVQIKH